MRAELVPGLAHAACSANHPTGTFWLASDMGVGIKTSPKVDGIGKLSPSDRENCFKRN